MTSYEFTGKSVKEAIAKACEELRTEESLLEVEVLEESARGFLGIVGHRDARVRVRKRDILREISEVTESEPVPEETTQPVEIFETDVSGSDDSNIEPEIEQERSFSRVDPTPYKEQAAGILQDILDRIPIQATIESTIKNEAIHLDIQGDGSGLLIGKKGQTLDSLQFLINKILNKDIQPGSKVEVIVDSENYRLRRHENLREMAVKMSQKVKKTLKPASFNPMPPQERRMIHLILAEDKEVYTKSYGEGAMRRIIVYPRRLPANKRRRR